MNADERLARRQARSQMLKFGIPPAYVDQVVDLGFHAAQRGMEAMMDVVFSAGDERIGITAVGIAAGVLQARLATLEADLPEIAAGAGLRSATLIISPSAETAAPAPAAEGTTHG